MTEASELMIAAILFVVGCELIMVVAQGVADHFEKYWLVDQIRMMMLVLLAAAGLGFGLYLVYQAFLVVFG
jgi:hypothetical protein